MEITRIEVQERLEVETGEADSIGVLEISFSDGKTQELHLAGHVKVMSLEDAKTLPPPERGSAALQVFYIEPAVTHSLTIRVPRLTAAERSRNPQNRLGLRSLRVWGQPLSAMWEGQVIGMDRSGYTRGAFNCPPTTFFSANQHACVPCPYPLVSNEGSVGGYPFESEGLNFVQALEEIQGEGSCYCPVCGDGGVQWEADEKCDDGNQEDDDGCSSRCVVENLYLCSGPFNSERVGLPRLSYKTPDTCIRIGSAWVPYGQADWPGGPRFGAQALLHRDALWLVGGISSGYTRQFSTVLVEATNGENCPLRTPDESCAEGFPGGTSLNWLLASPDSATPWQARGFMGVVTYRDRIYVMGGAVSECVHSADQEAEVCDLAYTLGDVWQSSVVAGAAGQDLSSLVWWNQVTPSAPWRSRARAAVIVFEDLIWLMGGQFLEIGGTINSVYNDVWTSSDGQNWNVITRTEGLAMWSRRCGSSVSVHVYQGENAIFIMGGYDTTQYLNDVWASWDGASWFEVTRNAAFSARWQHASVTFRNNLWVIGGHSCVAPPSAQDPAGYVCTKTNQDAGTFYNDVWYSEDGAYWRPSTLSAAWSPRYVFHVDSDRFPTNSSRELERESHRRRRTISSYLSMLGLALRMVWYGYARPFAGGHARILLALNGIWQGRHDRGRLPDQGARESLGESTCPGARLCAGGVTCAFVLLPSRFSPF